MGIGLVGWFVPEVFVVSMSMCFSGKRGGFCENCDRKKFGMGGCLFARLYFCFLFLFTHCSIVYLNAVRMNKWADCFTMRSPGVCYSVCAKWLDELISSLHVFLVVDTDSINDTN